MPAKPTSLAITLFTLFVSMALLNCRASEKSMQDTGAAFDSLVKSKLGATYSISYNASKTHALCQQKRSGDHSRRNFKYIVVSLSDNKLVREGTYRMGYVRWHDENSIEVLNSASLKNDDKSSEKRIIDIRSNQR